MDHNNEQQGAVGTYNEKFKAGLPADFQYRLKINYGKLFCPVKFQTGSSNTLPSI